MYAINRLKARRIGHGLALGRGLTADRSGMEVAPEELIAAAKAAGTTVEVCLTSNVGHVRGRKVPDGYRAHPVGRFFEAGLPFSLRWQIREAQRAQ